MEGRMEVNEDMMKIREQLRQLQERVESARRTGDEQYRSLLGVMPDLERGIELSLKVLNTSFPFLPMPPDSLVGIGGPRGGPGDFWGGDMPIGDGWGTENWEGGGGWDGGRSGAPSMNALGFLKSMVAACLLDHSTALPVESGAIYHRLVAKDMNLMERDAITEVGGGGETGGVAAVELALHSLADGPYGGGIEIDEFIVAGMPHLMVVNFDRARLLKELPGGHPAHRMGDPHHRGGDPHLMSMGLGHGMDTNSGPLGMPARPPEMWVCGGEPRMQGGAPLAGPGSPMFPGGGGPPHMVPRGGPRGMGMLGMPGGGMGFGGLPSPFQRPPMGPGPHGLPGVKNRGGEEDDIDALLNKKSFKELQQSKTGEELLELLHRPTAKETAVAAKFKTKGGSALKEYCPSLTKEDCRHYRSHYIACEKMHFRRIIAPHTDSNLGDCSFLDTCRHMKTCKYVHYELDPIPDVPDMLMGAPGLPSPQRPLSRPQRAEYCSDAELGEPQWIQCDIRTFKMDVLGQFGVIMADPPWDIHMELPYGTMADDEMRNLNVPALQTDGLIFLWVTGRAMELGRECLELWGYKRVEEIIWVKTNQLQRIIRTGRTGHWLNHSKEHCLVGIKGHPDVNRNIDTDVIVAEVRETSRKPDEMYPLLERISPRTRKLELFARMHNTHAGWISLGNQLQGVRLVDEGLRARYKAAFPDQEIQPRDPPSRSTGQQDGRNIVHDNNSSSTQPKSSPVASSAGKVRMDVMTATTTITISGAVIDSGPDEKPDAQDTDMLS
ncbi:unnamed protein product [Sphagnum troendelagicum]|uniref:N6-adenosine-methyltransferase MT-A70-like n=1 Tax=Sphagnum troendelagicum TaxID=128251 RepID=A0ABP0UYM8_9BRYO